MISFVKVNHQEEKWETFMEDKIGYVLYFTNIPSLDYMDKLSKAISKADDILIKDSHDGGYYLVVTPCLKKKQSFTIHFKGNKPMYLPLAV